LLGRVDLDLDDEEETGVIDLDVHTAGTVPIGALFDGNRATRRWLGRE
jgi:hypothetical protein